MSNSKHLIEPAIERIVTFMHTTTIGKNRHIVEAGRGTTGTGLTKCAENTGIVALPTISNRSHRVVHHRTRLALSAADVAPDHRSSTGVSSRGSAVGREVRCA
ncbi:hypothetical protein [Lentzea xinjiangensis]|uniref:hypothetical protein n=1 Tax=Lentzea xinjiangensis TaxID=402600 RepID=UPI00116051A3|nr:hypothetical protein [Lentzea xinjiangensis]